MKTRKRSKSFVKISLLSVLLILALSTASVFLGVSAAEDNVSSADADVPSVNVSYDEEDADNADGSEESVIPDETETPEKSIDAEEWAVSDDESTVFDEAIPSDERADEETVEGTSDFAEVVVDGTGDFVTGQFLPSTSYKGDFRSELTDVEKLVYDGYYDCFVVQGRETGFTVDVSASDVSFQFDASSYDAKKDVFTDASALKGVEDIILSATAAFYYDHPEIYWIKSYKYNISYVCHGNDGYLTSVTIHSAAPYEGAYDDLATVQKGISAAVTAIRKSRKSATRYDTLKAIHDYICNNVAYDYAAAAYGSKKYGDAYTPAPLFNGKGKFVCVGYAKSFKILCDQFNLPCALVLGYATTTDGDSYLHIWNYAQMEDGRWYAVDVTWDDNRHGDPYDTYFLIGSTTDVGEGRLFRENHKNKNQTMATDTAFPLVYPPLSQYEYDPNVGADSIALNQSSLNMKVGDTFALVSTVKPDTFGGTVTWSSSNSRIASVTSNGRVKAVSNGTATITARVGHVYATCTVKVERTVTITSPTLTLNITRSKPNPTATLTAKVTGSSVSKTWYSDNTAVATVTSGGKVTALKEGTAKIYCKTADGFVSEPCVVTVGSFLICTENANSIIDNVAYVTENGTCKLFIPNVASGVTWKSSNVKVASVNSTTGVVKGVKKGTVTITATASSGVKETIKLTVYKATTTLSLNAAKVNVYSNGTFTLKATLSKNANDPVTWSSSNTSVATVTSKGVVKGLKPGTATITAKTFSGKTASAVVTVRTKATAIAFDEVTSAVLVGGKTGTFTAEITAPAGCNDSITWTSSSKAVATVTTSNDGRTAAVKGLKKGTATITAKTGSGKKVTYKVTVVNAPADSIKITNGNVSLYTGASATLKTQVTPKASNDLVTWSSSNSSVVTVDQKGKIKGLKQGTATVYATTKFGGKQSAVTVIVRTKAKSVSVNRTSAAVRVGETVTLNVTAITPDGCNDTLKWTTSSKAVAQIQVSGDGKSAVVTGLKKGSATVTVKTGSGKSQRIKVTVAN